jgi:16S rRNA (cytidine1402-2'-O)-methyltransferase
MSEIDPKNMPEGGLYLVSTPIGNLQDISQRAIAVLEAADTLLAEDTRTASYLLKQFNIRKKVLSYYAYNEMKRLPQILGELKQGKMIALISEAGTPLISDPGHKLVMAAIQQGIPVISIPGPAAFLTALVASGLPTDRFVFEGFLPRKKGRNKTLQTLSTEAGTIILYESAMRIEKTIEDIVKIFGSRYIVIARELTKKFEEFIRGDAEEVLQILRNKKIKGEIVLLIAGTKFKPFSTQ